MKKNVKATIDNYHVELSLIKINLLIKNIILIKFDAVIVLNIDLIFKFYHYATILMNFIWKNVSYNVCFDIDCIMILIDKQFLKKFRLERSLKKFQIMIFVREMNIKRYLTNDYLIMNLYIKEKIENKNVVTYLRQEVHVMNNLKIKLLFNMNVIIFERMIINLNFKKFTINNCKNLKINIKITFKNNTWIQRTFKIERKIVVETNIIIKIFITFDEFLSNRDYLFKLKFLKTYTHVINVSLSFIYMNNINVLSITIFRQINMN